MLLIGPFNNRKVPLCKDTFFWALPKLHILSQVEDAHMLPYVYVLGACVYNILSTAFSNH